ncbi:MAG: beta-ketoacyl-ACP reductase [Candidatus Terraquivivens tikiterensis]|uniref:Beta-ketoacyl-ACP reductase n=1 Tax=Candidatus Terraquivivens tikiterensis TaxID=1980982 RepID=A0A2R7Y656_9ARCH|nr:MAG: beta-ketoacyl-ACP reductase [Candidatus Terraquivivens tikiterensis]
MGELDGKVAIVTGSGRGIGRAIALALASKGADVVVNVSKSVEEMNRVVKEIKDLGRKAIGIVADVSRMSEAEKLIKETIGSLGKVDILVNNAGIARPAMCYKITEEEWSSVINVNLTGTLNCIRAVAPHMIERRTGKIINIASIAGRDGMIGNINYAASKAGIFGLTKTAAKELARYGITVNAVAPGFIETAMTEWLKEPKFQEKYIPRIPLGRIGKPEEVAALVVFLASDKSNYITGEIIALDGGLVMI